MGWRGGIDCAPVTVAIQVLMSGMNRPVKGVRVAPVCCTDVSPGAGASGGGGGRPPAVEALAVAAERLEGVREKCGGGGGGKVCGANKGGGGGGGGGGGVNWNPPGPVV